MLSKHLIAVIFVALVFSSLSLAQVDKIGIFTEAVSWTDVGAANAAADFIINNVTSANDITIFNDADMAGFAEANTNDGDFDIIITFGYFPVSLYAPGNADPDGSVAELFLEGGDMLLNTADWIFYVTQGGGANGADGLKNITDSAFDMNVADGIDNSPTDDGKTYTPSLPDSYGANRVFKLDQIEADADWEVEKVFGSNGENNLDPAIIRNVTYGGRVAIAFQIPAVQPRGEVISEMIDNYLAGVITAVEPVDKLAVTWGGIK